MPENDRRSIKNCRTSFLLTNNEKGQANFETQPKAFWAVVKPDFALQASMFERPNDYSILGTLPTFADMALIWDRKFKPYVEQYARDDEKFATDFSAAFSKLLELGVPFAAPGTPAPHAPIPSA